jgi:hypothetical protein
MRDQGKSYPVIQEGLKKLFPDARIGGDRNLGHRYKKAKPLVKEIERNAEEQ